MLCLLPETGPDEVFNFILGLDSPGTSLSKVIIHETISVIKSTFSVERKRAAIVRFLEIYKDASVPSKNKLLLVSCFINPLLAHCVKADEVVIDARLGEALLTDVVGKDNLAEATQGYLELGGLVVEQLYKLDEVPGIIEEFGENATQVLLSRNITDQGIQTGRYLLVSRLCNEKKPNIIKSILILKILFSLLKIGSIEGKGLIDEAVDNLLPITFHCMKSDPVLKNNFFAHLETLLNDDSMQRNRIFRLLLKYPNFFYIKHEMFTKHIINLNKSRSQQDAKRFNCDLTNLLVTWEKVRMYPESYTEPIEIENHQAKDKGIFNGVIEMLHQEPEESRAWSETNGNNFLHLIVRLYITIFQHQQQEIRQTQQPKQQGMLIINNWVNSHDFAVVSNILEKLVMLFPKGLFSATFYPKGIEVNKYNTFHYHYHYHFFFVFTQEQNHANAVINRYMMFKEYEIFTHNEQAFASAVLMTADLSIRDRVKEIFISYETFKIMRESLVQILKHLILLEDFKGYTPEQRGRLSNLFKTVHDCIIETLEKRPSPQLLTLVLEVCREVNETKPYMTEHVLRLYEAFATEKQKAIERQRITEDILLCFDVLNNAMRTGGFEPTQFIKTTFGIFDRGLILNPLQLAQRIAGWVVPSAESGAKPLPNLSDEMVRVIVYNFGKSAMNNVIDCSQIHRSMADAYAARVGKTHFFGKASNEFVVRSWFFDVQKPFPQDRSLYFDSLTDESTWRSVAGANVIPLLTELMMSLIACNTPLVLSKGNSRLARASTALPESRMEVVTTEDPRVSAIIRAANNLVGMAKSSSEVHQNNFISAIQEVIHDEEVPVQQVFESVLTNVWKSLSDRTRTDYRDKIKRLLVKDLFIEQRYNHANSINSFLMGAFKCEPKIVLPDDVLRFLGRTYNAWNVALQWIQRDYAGAKDVWMNTARMYRELNEEDNYRSLMCTEMPETKDGFVLEGFNQYVRAKEVYIRLLREREDVREGRVWEESYVNCCKKLGQFDALEEYANAVQNTPLSLEMAIRVNDVPRIKEILSDGTIEEEFGLNRVLGQIQAKVTEIKLPVEQTGKELTESLIMSIMHQWLTMPPTSDRSRVKMYNLMQQSLEIKQIENYLKSFNEPGVKNTLAQWRERLPNTWEDISVWNELFCWRKMVTTQVLKNFTTSFMGPHETAWHIDKQSQIFRKHLMPEPCLGTLQRIYKLPNIEIPEAYYKLKNQIKCHIEIGKPNAGLDVVQAINMSFFDAYQGADFFRLKGDLLCVAERPNEAYVAYKNAVELCPCLPSAWSAWGFFCMSQLSKLLSGIPIGDGYPMGNDITQWALSALASFVSVHKTIHNYFFSHLFIHSFA